MTYMVPKFSTYTGAPKEEGTQVQVHIENGRGRLEEVDAKGVPSHVLPLTAEKVDHKPNTSHRPHLLRVPSMQVLHLITSQPAGNVYIHIEYMV